LVLLEGGCNFREVDRYRSGDGRYLRAGSLYRSGVLSYLTAADQRVVQQLGIRTIVDLRRAEERRREPTRWVEAGTRVLHREQTLDPPPLLSFALREAPNPPQMRQAMIELYRAMADSQAERLRAMCEALIAGELPMLVHCSGGKDRTGFAVAVLLELLGIERAQIVRDYSLTNEVVDLERFVVEHRAGGGAGIAAGAHPLLRLPPDVRGVLFTADPAYLDAALERLESEFGSVQGYARRCLGLDVAALDILRNRMLTA